MKNKLIVKPNENYENKLTLLKRQLSLKIETIDIRHNIR